MAQGFAQVKNVDYFETYSPVVKGKPVRLLLALAKENDWVSHHVDVSAAYLNGELDEEIFMTQPPGFEQFDKENMSVE